MILDEIAEKARERVYAEMTLISHEEMQEAAELIASEESESWLASAEAAGGGSEAAGAYAFAYPFEKALRAEGLSIISEVKKASPSKGVIAEDFPYLEIAREYERAGANAISCLTEPFYFKGSNQYLEDIAKTVKIPVLRKDFTVDPYMIYQAKIMGASAVLLICAILDDDELNEYYDIAKSLGLSALVETHDEKEIERALAINNGKGPNIIGINNRNLKDFTVDIENSVRLREMVPADKVFVSESGIKTPADTEILLANKTDAVLIGETLMRTEDKAGMIKGLKHL